MSLKPRRRRLLAAATLGLLAGGALAQASAERQGPWKLIAPFPPGGPVDSLARLVATGLQSRHGAAAVVLNQPGANGNLGIEAVKRAAPDGKTLLVIPAGNLTINPTLMPAFPFNVQADFVPVAMLAKAPNVLVAHPGVAARNATELVALAKAQPGKLAFASPGIGSGLHLAGELFQLQTGTELLHVPYKGTGQALVDNVGGAVPLMFSNLPGVLAQVRAGKLRAIAVGSPQRVTMLPDVKTIAEQGIKGYDAVSWGGLLAPLGTPKAVVDRIITNLGVFDVVDGGLKVVEMAPGVSRDEIGKMTQAKLVN